MKSYVLMISERFPKSHIKSGLLTRFPLLIEEKIKIHTIRGNYPLWKKRFEEIENDNAYLSVRCWEGKPYRSKQVEMFRFYKKDGIGVQELTFEKVGNYLLPKETSIINLAANDGLNITDFKQWFKDYDFSNSMAIIHFTSFRYND